MSLPYSIAAALSSGGAMLDQYNHEALLRSDVRDLARRVTVTYEPSVPNGAEPFVDVVLKDGRVLTGRKKVARGDCTDPLSEDELRGKFRLTAGVAFDAERVAELERTIARVTELADVNELVALLAPRAGANGASEESK
jgi:2-methylcitrate dehydratase PrpD